MVGTDGGVIALTGILVFVMVVLFSLQSLFMKLFSQSYPSSDGARTTTVFSVVYGLFVGAATLAVAGFHLAPSGTTWLLGCLNAAALFTFNMSMIQASRLGSYSIQMISLLFGGIIVPMVYGVIVLGETLTALQIAAVFIMLVSFVLMNLQGLSLKSASGRFLGWCLAVFLANGFYGVLMNEQQNRMAGAERSEMIAITFFGMALMYIVLQLIRDPAVLRTGFRMSKRSAVYLVVCCSIATVAVHMILYILTLVDQTVLYTIDNGGGVILSVVYSRLLFKEKLSVPQLIGAGMALVSIVMLSV